MIYRLGILPFRQLKKLLPKNIPKSIKGLVSVEVVILALGLLGGIHMVLFAGRLSQAQGEVQDIAAEAARIASQAQNAEDANQRIQEFPSQTNQTSQGKNGSENEVIDADRPGVSVVSSTSTDSSDAICNLELSPVSSADFSRGEEIEVLARCEVSLSDLIYLQLPGSIAIEATAVEIIDVYRSQGP